MGSAAHSAIVNAVSVLPNPVAPRINGCRLSGCPSGSRIRPCVRHAPRRSPRWKRPGIGARASPRSTGSGRTATATGRTPVCRARWTGCVTTSRRRSSHNRRLAAVAGLPSLGYLPGGPAGLTELNKHIDDAAVSAGRDPAQIRRLLNIGGRFATTGRALLDGPPDQWAEDLAGLTLEHGITGFILAADDAPTIELFAAEVAPATRELVAAERGTTVPH